MHFFVNILLLSLVIFISGCGGGSGSTNELNNKTNATTKTIHGTAIDGYISGAKVCVDENLNNKCDTNESYVFTDNNGSFTLDINISKGTYSIITIGGVDTATNEDFNGILKEIIDINETNDSTINTVITPLTTMSALIYEDEKKLDSNFTPKRAKKKLAENLGISEEKITADPLKDKEIFAKTQQIIQTIKILQKSVQKEESNDTVTQDMFVHISKNLALSLKESNNTEELNVTKVVENIEKSEYKGEKLEVDENVEVFVKGYVTEINEKANNYTDTNTLGQLQNEISTYTKKAEENIALEKIDKLIDTLVEIRNELAKSNENSNNKVISDINISDLKVEIDVLNKDKVIINKDNGLELFDMLYKLVPSWDLYRSSYSEYLDKEMRFTNSCLDDGEYKLDTEKEKNHIEYKYTNCSGNNIVVDGSVHFVFDELKYNSEKGTFFTNNLSIKEDDNTTNFSFRVDFNNLDENNLTRDFYVERYDLEENATSKLNMSVEIGKEFTSISGEILLPNDKYFTIKSKDLITDMNNVSLVSLDFGYSILNMLNDENNNSHIIIEGEKSYLSFNQKNSHYYFHLHNNQTDFYKLQSDDDWSSEYIKQCPNNFVITLPEVVYTNNDINLSVEMDSNYEYNKSSISYAWYKNDNLLDNNISYLSNEKTKFGDIISVEATFKDCGGEIKSNKPTLTISDSPAVVAIQNLPQEIPHGELVEFNVSITDLDEPKSQVNIAYGPQGMTIDSNGLVKWKPNEVMLQKKEVFHFGFSSGEENSEIVDKSVVVVDENRSMPIARSGIEIPYKNHSLWIGDFDNDENKEILSLGRKSLIFILEFDGSSYKQEWLYPFSLPVSGDVNKVVSVDMDQNGKNEIIAISEGGISYIKDLNSSATIIYESNSTSQYSTNDVIDGTVSDIDNDGTLDVVFIRENGDDYEVLVYDISTKQEKLQINLASEAKAVVVGNVDNDDNIEIVLSNGYIYDGKSGVNEWYYSSGFGDKIALGDLDNNGIKEIIATERWGNPTIYSAVKKSELWEIDNNDICTINSMNIDDDPQDELLIGDCQWGYVRVYDGSTSKAVEQSKWSNIEHASISVTAGDIDNDGKFEVIWGSGFTSSGEDVLVVAEQGDTQPWYNKNPSQLLYFAASGWAKSTVGKQHAVYVVPDTDGGDDGQRIVTMDLNGNLKVSSRIGTNWDRAYHSTVTDYDNDGLDELFLATASTYDGELKVVQLNNFNVEYSGYGGEYENTIKEIEAADVNNDGFSDVILVDNSRVQIIDIYNQVSIWSSTSFSYGINDIEFLNGDAVDSTVVVASGEEISTWQKDGNNYIRINTLQKECERIEKIGDEKIVCLEESYNKSNFLILDSNLSISHSFKVDGEVQDFIVEENSSNNLLVSIEVESGYYSGISKLVLISSLNGKVIWTSPELPGDMYDRSIHYIPSESNKNKKLMFATKKAMYITK